MEDTFHGILAASATIRISLPTASGRPQDSSTQRSASIPGVKQEKVLSMLEPPGDDSFFPSLR
ncbi:hypothetical protein CVT26_000659 [Gymnopilus dilepis]|uniref:Uncharacterized protein n=1 Tax=Gymnopilus dilepis TaxID=231916 RepID=A0A409Y2M2_9AGAR|nr:hypothetical protein CVT26_000659 [Gymnopilus dilepis]